MSLKNFSGVFGVYEGTKLIESGAYGFADKNFRIKNNTNFCYGTASGFVKRTRTSYFLKALILAFSFSVSLTVSQSARLQSALTTNSQTAGKSLKNTLRWFSNTPFSC